MVLYNNWLIDDTFAEQGVYQSNELSCRQYKGPLVLMLTDFPVLLPVVFTEDGVISPDRVCSFYEIIPQVFICSLYQSFLFPFKVSTLVPSPHQSCQFGDFIVTGVFIDVTDLGDYSRGEYISDTRYSGQCVGEGFEFIFYGSIHFFEGTFEGADISDDLGEYEVVGAGEVWFYSVGFSGGLFEGQCDGFGVFEAVFTLFSDEFLDYFDGFLDDFFRGLEFFNGGEGGSGGYLGEGFVLGEGGELDKEGVEEGVYFSDEVIDEVESVSCESFEGEEWVIWGMRVREAFAYSQEVSDDGGVDFIGFVYIAEGFSESIELEGVKSKDFWVEGVEFRGLGEEVGEVPVVVGGSFEADDNFVEFKLGGDMVEEGFNGLCAFKVVGEGFLFDGDGIAVCIGAVDGIVFGGDIDADVESFMHLGPPVYLGRDREGFRWLHSIAASRNKQTSFYRGAAACGERFGVEPREADYVEQTMLQGGDAYSLHIPVHVSEIGIFYRNLLRSKCGKLYQRSLSGGVLWYWGSSFSTGVECYYYLKNHKT